jgi:ABC-2 type transport system ATP-binding protein
MRVRTGEIAGFLGPNGSGKTTTIRVMCGLLTPDEGRGPGAGHDIRTDGQRIKREVGYMTQSLFALRGPFDRGESALRRPAL